MPDDTDGQPWQSQDGGRKRQPRPEPGLEDELNQIMEKMNAPRTRTIAGATAASLSLALSEMTHEMPPPLQRYPREELADRILAAEHALSENGEFIAWLDGQWYYANPDRSEQFLLLHNGRAFHFERIGVVKARVMSERRQAESRGFDVSRLDRALDMDDEAAEKELSSYQDDWGRAEEVLRHLNELDTRGFEQEVEVLGSVIRSLERLGDAKTAIYLLEKKIGQKKREMAPLLPKLERDIDALQADGYMVVELRRLLAKGDVPAIERAIQDFENDIDRLKELEKRGHRLRQQGFDVEIDLIKHHFSDPSKIPLIEKEIDALEEEIRKEEARQGTFSDIEAKVAAWEEDGYDTKKLKTMFTKDMDTIQAAVENFKRAVERLDKMRKLLGSFEGQGIDKEIAKVRGLTRNVENLDKVGQAINTLREILEENRALEQSKRVHREKVEAWKVEGWTVDSLLPLFDGDIGELETGIAEFEGKMQVLRTHLEVLDAMDIAGFEKEAAVIRRMALNPKNMDKVKEAIETLAQAIEENREAQKPRMPTIHPPQELCRLIESVPKGLPSSLWGRTPDELAEAIAKGPFGNTPNRKVVVRLSRRWYYYEPDEPNILLQPYDGDVELLDMRDATEGR